MSKKFLESGEMSSSGEYVEDASDWAKALVLSETRCAGDYGNAMRRVARKLGVPFSVIWNLHYRPPKTVAANMFERLGASYAHEYHRHQRQGAGYAPRTALGRLVFRAAASIDGLADALDRQEDGAVDG